MRRLIILGFLLGVLSLAGVSAHWTWNNTPDRYTYVWQEDGEDKTWTWTVPHDYPPMSSEGYAVFQLFCEHRGEGIEGMYWYRDWDKEHRLQRAMIPVVLIGAFGGLAIWGIKEGI